MMKPLIVTITGPSCAGKSTLEGHLKKLGFATVVSTTTREPRVGEVNGVNYYFVSDERFEQDYLERKFIERVEFGGSKYGVYASEVERLADLVVPIVIVVDPDGCKQVASFCAKKDWNIHRIFVNNDSQVISRRFLARMRDELLGVKDQASVLARYSERLATMMNVESQWAKNLLTSYDRILHRFLEQDVGPALRGIMLLAQNRGYMATKCIPEF